MDSPAHEVSRRGHRHWLLGDVDAMREALLGNVREVSQHVSPVAVADVQQNMRVPSRQHLVLDCSGHYIPGRQLLARVIIWHEPERQYLLVSRPKQSFNIFTSPPEQVILKLLSN